MTDLDELIAEARKLIAHTKTYNFGMWSADKLAHEVAGDLADALESVRAERDAALAAIERVRAIDTGNNRALYGNEFEAGMAKALWLVKTALDGSPEPAGLPVEGESKP